MSRALLNQVLTKYFTNYSSEKLDINIFQGRVNLNDLVFDPVAFNGDFDRMNIPFMFKFGTLKKMLVDISLINQCLEEIVLEDLVIIIGPDPSKADREFHLSQDEQMNVLLELAQRHNQYVKWQTELEEVSGNSAKVAGQAPELKSLQSHSKLNGNASPAKSGAGFAFGGSAGNLNPRLESDVLKKLKDIKKLEPCKSLPKGLVTGLQKDAQNDLEAFRGAPKPDYKTPQQQREFLTSMMTLLLGSIDAKITINNLRIYYEDTTTLRVDQIGTADKNKGMAICLALDGIKIAKVKPDEALTKEGSFRGMFNMNEFPNLNRAKASEPDFFQIHIRYFGLEINFLSEPMIPDELAKKDLKKTADVNELTKYFKEFAEKHKDSTFTLMAAEGIRFDLMGAHDGETVKVFEILQLYNIVAVSLHLGSVSMNFDLDHLNDFLKVVANLRAIMLLSQTADFRPFFKPITKDLTQKMEKKYGPQVLTEEVKQGLKEIGKLIIKDYFRLFMFTKLLRGYGGTEGLDVKKRLTWKFKKSSLIYQLMMGCTLAELLEKEKTFFASEKQYVEMKKAIQLHERLLVEDQIKLAAGESALETYVKNIRKVSDLLHKAFLNIRISIGLKASLVDLENRNTNDLDIELGNHVIEFKKPKGDLKGQLTYRLDRIYVQIEEAKSEGEMFNKMNASELNQPKGLTEHEIQALVTGIHLRRDTEYGDQQ